MKIISITLNCRRDKAANGETGPDAVLYYFRSPVVFSAAGHDKVYKEDTAIIFSSGYKQYFRSADGSPIRYDCVRFRSSSADRQYMASMNLPIDSPVEISDGFVISSTLKSMKSRSQRKGKHLSEFMELCMRILFISLSEAAEPVTATHGETIPRYAELKKLRDDIYDDPMNDWSVDTICDDLNISKAYFHRLYLEAFGVTCRQDVIESRLMYAGELLKNTDLSISAIAEQCGYDSDSYFMRQFKQHKGCTPSEFRRRIPEQNE